MEQVEALKERLAVFDDSAEVVEALRYIEGYAAKEAAVHIDGLWELAQQLMKYIEEKTNG
tara:strand:+ start:2205 stop:2384 length:180 start_codon:yes stop_codon:yes gene_type:complete